MKNFSTCLILIFGTLSLTACGGGGGGAQPQSIADCPGTVTKEGAEQVAKTQGSQPCSFQKLSQQIANAQANGQLPSNLSQVNLNQVPGMGSNPLTTPNNSASNQVGTRSIGIASISNEQIQAQSAKIGQALANIKSNEAANENGFVPSGSNDARGPASSAAPIAAQSVSSEGGGGGEVPGGAAR